MSRGNRGGGPARYDRNPYRNLWRTVLVRGLKDARNNAAKVDGSQKQIVNSARDWIGSAGFRRVCAYADLPPDRVLSAVRAGRLDDLTEGGA